jgi:hypothetical protein
MLSELARLCDLSIPEAVVVVAIMYSMSPLTRVCYRYMPFTRRGRRAARLTLLLQNFFDHGSRL